MTQREELDLILTLIKKYELPLSPILEYAINEKKEEYSEEEPVPDEEVKYKNDLIPDGEFMPEEEVKHKYAPIPDDEFMPEDNPVFEDDSIPDDELELDNKLEPEELPKPLVEPKDEKEALPKTYYFEWGKIKDAYTIELTREIIEAARTPNGGFTKSQLAVLGIPWPAPANWIELKIGTFITKKQYEDFNHIEYAEPKQKRRAKTSLSDSKKHKDKSSENSRRMDAILNAMEHFVRPASLRDIARTVSHSAWGGTVKEDEVCELFKKMPEVEKTASGAYTIKNQTPKMDFWGKMFND